MGRSAPFDRLASLPWLALRGLGPLLEPALDQVLRGESAERVLDRFLRAHKDFTAEQRTVSAESLFGVGLWRRRLALGLERPTALVLLARLVRDLAGVQDDVLGVAAPASPEPTSLADAWSLPDWLANALTEALPAGELEACARTLNAPGPICLRANLERVSRPALQQALAVEGITTSPSALTEAGLLVQSPARPNLLGTAASRDGLFEVQDEGSQCLGELLPRSGDVLDLCAGAGGKSLQLAARGATVHACDVDLARLERLRRRAEHARTSRIRIVGAAPRAGSTFPAVLVDAPCSELGALRRGPDLRFRLTPDDFARFPALQQELLERALRHLQPGGLLVYATCTFRREENEAVAEAFERAHPRLERTPPTLAGPDGFLRLWPHRQGTDGFFAACWRAP
ncbi:MAG: RsmB/NOP family class I SAM-dependent RNA methyltransferase [Myxococcaceae bacterium]|nr:RsmB/NOP family class I SAM-dependent RNA methyltransferase [Myxococcaceae bacterium]